MNLLREYNNLTNNQKETIDRFFVGDYDMRLYSAEMPWIHVFNMNHDIEVYLKDFKTLLKFIHEYPERNRFYSQIETKDTLDGSNLDELYKESNGLTLSEKLVLDLFLKEHPQNMTFKEILTHMRKDITGWEYHTLDNTNTNANFNMHVTDVMAVLAERL